MSIKEIKKKVNNAQLAVWNSKKELINLIDNFKADATRITNNMNRLENEYAIAQEELEIAQKKLNNH
ncbi:hypothetical protein KAI65_00550 [Candidatus Parcubacteria bacterium]|nr:hypothetical protein [Candidatus Parcubacteria bacterium]